MFAASNGNGESPTINTTTYRVLLSLNKALIRLEVKFLWSCYFWRCCNGAAMKTMARRKSFTRYYRDDPTLLL
jgi:hypothetical protein